MGTMSQSVATTNLVVWVDTPAIGASIRQRIVPFLRDHPDIQITVFDQVGKIQNGDISIDDPNLTRDMFDEVVGEFHKMWRPGEYAGFDGRFFSMPARNVLPKPYSAPHPPMWVAAGNPSTFGKAARMGLGVLCFTIGGPESVKPLVDLYKDEIGRAEPVGDFVNDNIMVTTQLLCLEDGQRARELGADLGMGYHRSLLLRYLDTFPRPAGIPEWPALLPDPTPQQIDASIAAVQRWRVAVRPSAFTSFTVTTRPPIFAGGDIVTGSATVILALGAGRRAANSIDEYLITGVW